MSVSVRVCVRVCEGLCVGVCEGVCEGECVCFTGCQSHFAGLNKKSKTEEGGGGNIPSNERGEIKSHTHTHQHTRISDM